MPHETTWRPHGTHGKLSASREAALPDAAFAFPTQRDLPLTDEGSVRNAIEYFGGVEDASDEERELAFANIQRAAAFYRVPMTETDWRQLGTRHVEPGYKRAERTEW
ncbi:MAG TPA: DUF6582 domain-containing protein [Coriobacteriia bacterium]|nr:DUF6582 domain-containing protein [Coriobacteriia bacterium]